MQTLLRANRLDETRVVLSDALQAHPSSGCVHQAAGTLLLQQKQPKPVSPHSYHTLKLLYLLNTDILSTIIHH